MALKDDANLAENIDQEAQVVGSYISREKRFQIDDAHLEPR
jgi:hypothetical protein